MSKSIFITGSSQGIGLGVAKFFAKHNFHIFLNYSSNDELAHLAYEDIKQLGGSVSLHKGDVRDEDSIIKIYNDIEKSGHSLETVVINAVHEIPKPIDEVTFDEWHSVLLTKLDGAFLTTKYAIPLLKVADNPSLVYITSDDGVRPSGEYIAYQVGTAGLIAMSIAQAKYLAKKYRIRSNAVSPGPVHSNLWKKAGESDEMWDSFNQNNPVGRVATTDDVAAAVWYLSQDPNKFINGTTINVDGGSQWN